MKAKHSRIICVSRMIMHDFANCTQVTECQRSTGPQRSSSQTPHFLTNKGRRGQRRGKGLVQGQLGFPSGSVVENPPASARDAGDTGSIPGSGRWLGGGNSNLTSEFLSGRSYGQRSLVGYKSIESQRVSHN